MIMKILVTVTIFIYLVFLGFAGATYAEDEVNPLELAALLIKNKNYARAANVLNDIEDPHEVIPERYWGLKGVLEIRQKRYDKALEAFQMAEKEGLKGEALILGKAEALLGLKKYTEGIEVLEKGKEEAKKKALFYQLKASLLFGAQKSSEAWESLNQGLKTFPKYLPLMKQRWFYLLENKLIEVSFETGKEMVDQYELTALDIARMGQKYRQMGDVKKAIFFGELARLKDPKDEEITKDLARSYIKGDKILAAAQLFKSLSDFHPEYLVEASELWRKAGYPVFSERLAMEIREPVKKIKITLTLALYQEDFTKMVLIGERAVRTELKEDQDIRYALAYAHFMLGDYEKTKAHLKTIGRDDLFKKAVALREAMESCSSGENLCL